MKKTTIYSLVIIILIITSCKTLKDYKASFESIVPNKTVNNVDNNDLNKIEGEVTKNPVSGMSLMARKRKQLYRALRKEYILESYLNDNKKNGDWLFNRKARYYAKKEKAIILETQLGIGDKNKTEVDNAKKTEVDKAKKLIDDYGKDLYTNNRGVHALDRIDSCIDEINSALEKLRKEMGSKASANKTNKDIIDKLDKSAETSSVTPQVTKVLGYNPTEAKTQRISDSTNLENLKKDSTILKRMVYGRHDAIGVNAAYFQSVPQFADGLPKNYANYHVNLSFPINRLKGKIKSPEKNAVWVFFRNVQVVGTGVINNSKLVTKDTTFKGDSIRNVNIGKNYAKTYINLLELRAYAFFNATLNFNIVTSISKNYSLYLDAFYTFSRTNIRDSTHAFNFGQYGINFTGRTTFHSPLNARLNLQLFYIEPNTNSYYFLNPLYKNITVDGNKPYTLPNLQSQTYFSLNFTLQYNISGTSKSTSDSKTTSSSQISGSTPSFVYASFGYNSNVLSGPTYLFSHNNYMTFQLGYSMDINTIVNTIKSASGFNKASSSSSSGNNNSSSSSGGTN